MILHLQTIAERLGALSRRSSWPGINAVTVRLFLARALVAARPGRCVRAEVRPSPDSSHNRGDAARTLGAIRDHNALEQRAT